MHVDDFCVSFKGGDFGCLGGDQPETFTLADVALHAHSSDYYVACKGKVYNLSSILTKVRDSSLTRIMNMSGLDVSSLLMYDEHAAAYEPVFLMPDALARVRWWEGDKYCVGRLTQGEISVRFVNVLSGFRITLRFPRELTLREIIQYHISKFNLHTDAYVFKYLDKVLNLDDTLDQYGIELPDERLAIPWDEYIPTIYMHFAQDDLLVM